MERDDIAPEHKAKISIPVAPLNGIFDKLQGIMKLLLQALRPGAPHLRF